MIGRQGQARWNQRCVLTHLGLLARSCATSASVRPARAAADVREALGVGLALPLDGGSVPPSAPSTAVHLSGPTPVLLCRGAVVYDGSATAPARPATAASLTV
jgi:tRNA A37 threonylcarbamoyladenosine synthetase subunit TsaC/SUA5/YrdC